MMMTHADSAFVDFVVESLGPLGPVRARRMFGGYGIYLDRVMFALVADDVLYLKVDDANRGAFEALGLEPFRYEARGRTHTWSYYEAPDAGLDDPEVLYAWARDAFAAAVRSRRARS